MGRNPGSRKAHAQDLVIPANGATREILRAQTVTPVGPIQTVVDLDLFAGPVQKGHIVPKDLHFAVSCLAFCCS